MVSLVVKQYGEVTMMLSKVGVGFREMNRTYGFFYDGDRDGDDGKATFNVNHCHNEVVSIDDEYIWT